MPEIEGTQSVSAVSDITVSVFKSSTIFIDENSGSTFGYPYVYTTVLIYIFLLHNFSIPSDRYEVDYNIFKINQYVHFLIGGVFRIF